MPSGHTSAVILASGSRSRAAMLSASGLDIQIQPADLDETSVKDACRDQGKSVDYVAAQLAREKAAAISLSLLLPSSLKIPIVYLFFISISFVMCCGNTL